MKRPLIRPTYAYDLAELGQPTEWEVRRLQREQQAALRLAVDDIERQLWGLVRAAAVAEPIRPQSPYRFDWPPVS